MGTKAQQAAAEFKAMRAGVDILLTSDATRVALELVDMMAAGSLQGRVDIDSLNGTCTRK